MLSVLLEDYNRFYYSLCKECEVYKTVQGYVNIVSHIHPFWSRTSIFMMKKELSEIGNFPGTSESSIWINQIYCITWYEVVTWLININKNGKDKFVIDVLKWMAFTFRILKVFTHNCSKKSFISLGYWSCVCVWGGWSSSNSSCIHLYFPPRSYMKTSMSLLVYQLGGEVILFLLGWGNEMPMVDFASPIL